MNLEKIDTIIEHLKEIYEPFIVRLVPRSAEFELLTRKYNVTYKNMDNIDIVFFFFLKGMLPIYYSNASAYVKTNYILVEGPTKPFPLYRPVFINFVHDISVPIIDMETKETLALEKMGFFSVQAADTYAVDQLFQKLHKLFVPMEMKLE